MSQSPSQDGAVTKKAMPSWLIVLIIVVVGVLALGLILSAVPKSTTSSTIDNLSADEQIKVAEAKIAELKTKMAKVAPSNLSAADHIRISNAEAEKAERLNNLEVEKAERLDAIAAAKATRDAEAAAKAAEVELEKLEIAAEKEIKLAELKAQADAAKKSRAERLEELKAAERMKNQSVSGPSPQMPQVAAWGYRPPQTTPYQGPAEEMVLLNGVLTPKSALGPNAIHCTEERCDTPVARHQGCKCGRCGGGNQCNGNTTVWSFLNDVIDVDMHFNGGVVQQEYVRPVYRRRERVHYVRPRCEPPPRPRCPPQQRRCEPERREEPCHQQGGNCRRSGSGGPYPNVNGPRG